MQAIKKVPWKFVLPAVLLAGAWFSLPASPTLAARLYSQSSKGGGDGSGMALLFPLRGGGWRVRIDLPGKSVLTPEVGGFDGWKTLHQQSEGGYLCPDEQPAGKRIGVYDENGVRYKGVISII